MAVSIGTGAVVASAVKNAAMRKKWIYGVAMLSVEYGILKFEARSNILKKTTEIDKKKKLSLQLVTDQIFD